MRILIILLLLPWWNLAQQNVEGEVVELNEEQKVVGLEGASVYWLNSSIGTITDFEGKFTIPYDSAYNKLVISYVGYQTDTITVSEQRYIRHQLKLKADLEEVVIKSRRKTSSTSYLKAENIINVSSAELLKAACCNLSESFETNPSIDVNFADAVSGTRQIRMLGLTSPYILITTENVPAIRGASQAFGLSFIPGTWVESIQITKGAGSVTNGFESITGQINAELQKPTRDNKLFVNAYGNLMGRLELNTHLNTRVSDRWSTGLYIHGNLRERKFDRNDDNFLDTPLAQQINVMNRWQYTDTENGFVSFINFRFMDDEKQTGQLDFDPSRDKFTRNFWGSEIDTRRFEASGKLGYVNPDIPYQSAGVQLAYSNHEQNSYFGFNTYDIVHNSVFASALYNSIIGDSRHKFKTGLSFTYDAYDEVVNGSDFNRVENSVGAFFEYAYDNLGDLTATIGLRVDQHNRLGTFATPRLHVRYTPFEKSALRFSVGRGKRSANIFTENQKFFASSRAIEITNVGGNIYGLDPEIAWNYGISYLQGFNLFGRKADITLDFYRTDFENQVVVDWEDPTKIQFYNLDGESYANNFQAEFNYDIMENADLRFAYKYFDVMTTYRSGALEKPLTPGHRIFANASAETNSKENGAQWKFDTTYNWLGEQRFPSTATNSPENRLPEFSPTVGTLNFQVTKVFSTTFEIYIGGENVTNVKQSNPIVGAQNPFDAEFDTTLVYGPIFGSMYYSGLRFKIE
ncbi:TonB-dependent receptor [Aureitalea sp. L0-47]|uniref:TonB-dependent receptor n=1 Tax=Aureitalea sp. L0-47 TaxID=2816962 RepID=UPI0022378AD7|nr:TonB-dependent receptor [Aureitalea sp. L0-47]MCW5518724.1 TonB-dependent receptor [Aureitalea sp. L0-47]